MQPRIVFLGTGGDSIVVGKQMRASGGIVVQVGDNQFHIDPGPGSLTMAKLFDISIRNTTAILCSHNHIIHANDVNAVANALTHGGMDTYGVLIASKSVVSGTEDMESSLTKYSSRMLEKVIALEPGQRVGVNDVEIVATRAKHTDSTAIGFKIMTDQFVLGYTSDTEYNAEMIEQFKNTDIMILNCVAPSGVEIDGHMNSDIAARILEGVKPKLAVITHFGVKMLAADPLQEARAIQKKTGIQTVAAKDGLVINPVSYSANLRQKTLNHY